MAVRMTPNNQELLAQGSQEDAEWPGRRWMRCREDAECLRGSRLAWRALCRKDIAEHLGGQQVASGAECPGGHLEPKGPQRGQEVVKQPGGCRMTRSAPNPEWPERLQAAWVVPISQERASPSGQGALQRVWSDGG